MGAKFGLVVMKPLYILSLYMYIHIHIYIYIYTIKAHTSDPMVPILECDGLRVEGSGKAKDETQTTRHVV